MFYSSVFQRKEFWLALADCVFSILGIVLTAFLSPENFEIAWKIVLSIQPVILILIGGMFAESLAVIKGMSPEALEALYGITEED